MIAHTLFIWIGCINGRPRGNESGTTGMVGGNEVL